MPTIPEALAMAVEHHQAGRLEAAEQIYRQILALAPNQPDAIHLLGVIAHQVGKSDLAVEYIQRAIGLKGTDAPFHYNLGSALLAQRKLDDAIACFRRALELKPDYAEAHNNLGNAFQGQGKLNDAIACYRRALELQPHFAEAHHNLGNAFLAQGKLEETVACCQRALDLKPDYAEAYNNLGNAFQGQGKPLDAATCYRQALELKPHFADAHNNLGKALQDQGKLDEAVACFCRALELRPDYAEAHYNLASALLAQEKLDDAVASYRRALELKPDLADAHYNLGNALMALGRLDDAVACYRRALELQPDFAEAHNNLGDAFKAQGNLNDAVACYRRALELRPHDADTHSNLVFSLNYCSSYDAKTIYAEQRRWNQRHAEPLAKLIQPHSNERSIDRRLRIGYVSPDFRIHVVGVFLLPLLEAHDHERFEVFCYASVRVPDAITDRCRAQADVWRDVRSFSDEQLAQTIRDDRIDILVDLAMHTANNRLLVFARKPAPVQLAYLASVGTTGLSAMDYRLSDPYLDPPDQDEPADCEASIRLPETYWCYRPLIQAPPVNTLPALRAGHITFGCLNNFSKATEQTLAAWAGILQAMPEARLLIHAYPGSHRDRVRDLLAQQRVSPDRVTFADMVPIEEYYRHYHRIDVALDPFPYGGGTTTCDALWMGVPVVTLAGQTAVGRGGLSILSNVGLADLVADDCEQYVRIALELAGDLPGLSKLRATLRERMQGSPLMDAPRFARNVEAAYREMWRRWCEE